MKIKKTSLIIVAAVAASLLTGCEGMLKSEHDKTTKGATDQWLQAKQGIMFEVAVQEYKVGDYDKCRETLKSALQTNVPSGPILTLSAKVEMEQGGNLEQAADYLRRATTANSLKGINDPEPYYLLGVVHQRWQQLDTACGYYEQAVSKKANEATYVLAVAEMKIALGQLDDAKDYLVQKMTFFESSAAMRIALARIALLQNDPQEAASQYREATLLSPEDKSVRWSYASALFDAGKFSDASKILEAMRRDPITMPKSTNTQTAVNDQKIEEEAAKSNKIALLMMLGESYVAIKRPLDGRDCFQEVIRLQPENTNAYISLGKACLVTNDLNLTIAAAKKVMRSDPKNVDAYLLQAAAQQKQQKWNDALDTLKDAGRLAPKDATVLCMQGLSELQLGKKELAVAFFEKAVANNPTDAWANDLLAQVKPTQPLKETSIPAPVQGSSINAAPTLFPTADAMGIQAIVPAAANITMVQSDETPATAVTNASPTDVGGQ